MANEISFSDLKIHNIKDNTLDGVKIYSVQGREAVSDFHEYKVTFSTTREELIGKNSGLGQGCQFSIKHKGEEKKIIGVMTEINHLGPDSYNETKCYFYQITVSHYLYCKRFNKAYRCFVGKTTNEIVNDLFGEGHVEWGNIQGQKWEQFVQYNESDLNCALRLLELEGLNFYAYPECSKIVIFTGNNIPGKDELPTLNYKIGVNYRLKQIMSNRKHSIADFEYRNSAEQIFENTVTGKIIHYDVADYANFARHLNVAKLPPSREGDEAIMQYEMRMDNRAISAGDHNTIEQDSQPLKNHTLGTFILNGSNQDDDCFVKEFCVEYSIEMANNDLISESSTTDNSTNTIKYIFQPGYHTFVAPCRAEIPRVEGIDTAIVNSGNENDVAAIPVDEWGRIQLIPHWNHKIYSGDAAKAPHEESFMLARVSHIRAMKDNGSFWLPRPGEEVIISYVNGNPNEPIIIGSVYNNNEVNRPGNGISGDDVIIKPSKDSTDENEDSPALLRLKQLEKNTFKQLNIIHQGDDWDNDCAINLKSYNSSIMIEKYGMNISAKERSSKPITQFDDNNKKPIREDDHLKGVINISAATEINSFVRNDKNAPAVLAQLGISKFNPEISKDNREAQNSGGVIIDVQGTCSSWQDDKIDHIVSPKGYWELLWETEKSSFMGGHSLEPKTVGESYDTVIGTMSDIVTIGADPFSLAARALAPIFGHGTHVTLKPTEINTATQSFNVDAAMSAKITTGFSKIDMGPAYIVLNASDIYQMGGFGLNSLYEASIKLADQLSGDAALGSRADAAIGTGKGGCSPANGVVTFGKALMKEGTPWKAMKKQFLEPCGSSIFQIVGNDINIKPGWDKIPVTGEVPAWYPMGKLDINTGEICHTTLKFDDNAGWWKRSIGKHEEKTIKLDAAAIQTQEKTLKKTEEGLKAETKRLDNKITSLKSECEGLTGDQKLLDAKITQVASKENITVNMVRSTTVMNTTNITVNNVTLMTS